MKEWVVNIEELVIRKDELMMIFFSTGPCLQFHVRDNAKQKFYFSLLRCDFAGIEQITAVNLESLCLQNRIISVTSTIRTPADCPLYGNEVLLEKGRDAS